MAGMKPIVSVGEAHISSIVAAYEVGTLTSKYKPVASLSACSMRSPLSIIKSTSTEGTNNTLIGFPSSPTGLDPPPHDIRNKLLMMRSAEIHKIFFILNSPYMN